MATFLASDTGVMSQSGLTYALDNKVGRTESIYGHRDCSTRERDAEIMNRKNDNLIYLFNKNVWSAKFDIWEVGTVPLICEKLDLKGQCHEIFDLYIFS